MEGIRACKHAMKSFTPQELGEGNQNAGGAKARSRRFEVLDRLAPLRAGLSPAQKNDWQLFKESWDRAMITEHATNWASLFAGLMQEVLGELINQRDLPSVRSMALWLYMFQRLEFDRSCGPTSSAVTAQHHPQWQLNIIRSGGS